MEGAAAPEKAEKAEKKETPAEKKIPRKWGNVSSSEDNSDSEEKADTGCPRRSYKVL